MRRLLISLALGSALAAVVSTQEAFQPDHAGSQKFYELATLAYDKDNLLQASRYLKKALQLNPENKQAVKLAEVID